MGARVREASKTQPDAWRKVDCPHCGQDYMTINGTWLAWKRQRAGLDQRTLAKKLGVSGPYLSDLERNRRECPDSILQAYKRLK